MQLDNGTCALIAELYYNYGRFGWTSRPTQKEIADALHLKRWDVVQALKYAEDNKLVTFSVNYEGERDHVAEFFLSHRLLVDVDGRCRQVLKPEVTRVVKPRVGRPAGQCPDERDLSRWEVGQLAASLAMDLISEMADRKPVTIGFSWGRTLRDMAMSFRSIESPAHPIHIVPTVGGFGGSLVEIGSDAIVAEVCRRLGFGTCYSLPAPGYVMTEPTRSELLKIPLTREIVDRWAEADLLFNGIGAMDSEATAIALREWLSPDDLAVLKAHFHAAGDLSLHFFTDQGLPLDRPTAEGADREVLEKLKYPVAVPLKDLQAAAMDADRHSIAVGSGTEKAESFLAAIRGGLIDGIVCDSETANEIARLSQIDPASPKQ